jgi:hypothetical protein
VFWATTLYAGEIVRFASPIIVVIGLILGMYSRRYSPLSSTTKTGDKRPTKGDKKDLAEVATSHHKSLDEIVDTLQEFTARCNTLLDPFLQMTDFLSTQTTPTAATTRPALTTLFIRVLFVTPFWILLTLPPFYVLTCRRVILTIGTIILTWHSKPARVSRVILWRPVLIRKAAAFVTGLNLDTNSGANPGPSLQTAVGGRQKSQAGTASALATKHRPDSSGVRFTFILYENQRRWLGLGWTTSLFAYERSPWTDEHLNPAPSKDDFELPEVDGGQARWRWVDGSDWRIERGDAAQHKRTASQIKTSSTGSKGKETAGDGGGWIYYDNKWDDGRREDGWGRYTRRRKWYRDAELVEATPSTEQTPNITPTQPQSDTEEEKINKAKQFAKGIGATEKNVSPAPPLPARNPTADMSKPSDDAGSAKSKKSGWFAAKQKRERSDSKSSSGKNTGNFSTRSDRSRDGPDDDHLDKWRDAVEGHKPYSVQEDVAMILG